jgi:deazaflavin-dependent oxidoreductase (nitroreductase family)
LVDPGPSSCLETLLAALEAPPKRLLLTHIHLDHAGASGSLVERFPELEVHVHEAGAPHLADPSRLLKSAGRLYGDRMEELWGEVLAVPERNLRPLSGGEELPGGLRVTYTPGHASHHVTYLAPDGAAYVGDVAGVRIPPTDYVLMPTPPPDIDLERWEDSIDRVEAERPARVCLTHFGAVEDAAGHLARARAALRDWVETAETSDPDAFVAAVRERVSAEVGPDEAARYEQVAPAEQLYLGLERYLRKHTSREDPRLAPLVEPASRPRGFGALLGWLTELPLLGSMLARAFRAPNRIRFLSTRVTRLHAWLLRRSGGRLRRSWAFAAGQPVLALTTIGRRSGRPRTTAVACFTHGPDLVVAGMNLGVERPPAWALNLEANPEATIEIGGRRIEVTARRAAGEEASELWRRWVELQPSAPSFRELAAREIPLFVLRARPPASG